MRMNRAGFDLGAAGGRTIKLLPLAIFFVFFAACFPFSGDLPHEKLDAAEPIDGPPCGMEPGILPCKPPLSTSSPEDPITATFAITDVILDQTNLDPPVGLDLDGIDSSPGSANEGQGECGATEGALDAKYGIDNVIGLKLWPDLSAALKIECEVERTHKRGVGTLLIHISGWNADKDDAEVTVTVVSSIAGFHRPNWRTEADAANAAKDWQFLIANTGTEEAPGYDLPFVVDADGNPIEEEPCWKPGLSTQDWFFANPRSFEGHFPRVRTTRAYISDYRLVVPLDVRAPIELVTDRRSVTIPLVGGYLVADIVDEATRLDNAFIAGRFRVSDLAVAGKAIGFCDASHAQTYSLYADLFRDVPESFLEGNPVISNVDCTSDGEDDLLGGAVSIGVGFAGVRVNYAGLPPNGVEVYTGPEGDGDPLPYGAALYHEATDSDWRLPDACEIAALFNNPAMALHPAECDGDYTYEPGAHCSSP